MELNEILHNRDVSIVFQPIVSLADAEVIGYEALSRGPRGSILERPDAMFAAAGQFDLAWELEYLCRAKALERAKEIIAHKMLFLNVDPQIINDPRFQKGHTWEMLRKFCANAGNVIFEITEKTAIEDYRSFCRILENYTSQGYKIAIDDTGSGYSGLKTLAQTRPNFIKVDMELVRDIDRDNLKQAMIKALYDFSLNTNSNIIAEGIETEEELAALINIGIPYGQGYYLQKPHADFLDLPPNRKQKIIEINSRKKRELFYTAATMPVGEIAQPDAGFPSSTPGYAAIDHFNKHAAIQGLPIVDDGKPAGLLMKNKFLANLATQYGVAVYMNRPVSILMDKHPLIVDCNTPLEQVSKLALTRKDDDIYDYIIVTKEERYFGVITVKRLLEKTTQLELNRAKHANPLTGLPGNVIIEEALEKIISQHTEYAVLYFDLDNFKAYNDVYGFEAGDKVICFTAEVIQQGLSLLGHTNVFIGHIGGDDFIAIVQMADVRQLCEEIIALFDSGIGQYFTAADRANGYIVTKNRHGQEEQFPITALSVAVVTSQARQFASVAELSEAASHVKKICKLSWKSSYNMY
ncbi:MAG: GGDEF domain-containing protein [Negativicutes bacterium]|nr:GGDEF domain-containing protein [Negativicutes bacterium]